MTEINNSLLRIVAKDNITTIKTDLKTKFLLKLKSVLRNIIVNNIPITTKETP